MLGERGLQNTDICGVIQTLASSSHLLMNIYNHLRAVYSHKHVHHLLQKPPTPNFIPASEPWRYSRQHFFSDRVSVGDGHEGSAKIPRSSSR